jgi:hypothetical protein
MNNIIPTNSIHLNIDIKDTSYVTKVDDTRYIIPAGTTFVLDKNAGIGEHINPNQIPEYFTDAYFNNTRFYYSLIHNMIINTDPLYCSYFSAQVNLDDYLMEFKDLTNSCNISIPSKIEEEKIYESLHKLDDASRNINCSFCGYKTCHDMMLAIYNGFNTKHNCCYSEKEETIYLSKMSYFDTLTSVMNRNAYERKIKSLYADRRSLALIVADVNG